MATAHHPPIGVTLSADVEYREGRPLPYRARVRWIEPATKRRMSKSESVSTLEAAQDWIDGMRRAALGGVDPNAATMHLVDYGKAVMPLAPKNRKLIVFAPEGMAFADGVTEGGRLKMGQPVFKLP